MKIEKKKPKILNIVGVNPYPPNDGGRICVYGFIDYLRQYYDFTLVYQISSPSEVESVDKLKRIWPEVNIREYRNFVVEKDIAKQKIPVFLRLLHLLKKIVKQIYSYLLKLLSDKAGGKNVEVNNPRPIYFEKINTYSPSNFLSEGIIDHIGNILESDRYDIVQVEFPWNVNLINILPQDVIKIFVLIESRQDLLHDAITYANLNTPYYKYIEKGVQLIENTLISKYSYVFTLSDYDKAKLELRIQGLKVKSSPFGLLDSEIVDVPDINHKIENLVFIGSESHYPNFDGVNWFITEMSRKIWEKFNLKFYVTGSWSNETKMKFQSYSNVVFTGFLDDLNEFLKNSILVVPIRLGGGGLRAKIMTAMAQGIPVISTLTGCYGIAVKNMENIVIANTTSDFLDALDILVNNMDFREKIIRSANNLIKENYTQRITALLRKGYYDEILSSAGQ